MHTSADSKLQSVNKIIFTIILSCLAVYLCFFDYQRSFSLSDESLHIQVTQEMWQSGQWWLPTHAGEPYFRKPPFKMWLTFLPLSILGENELAYRLIDMSLGVVFVLAVFAFTLKISGSAWAGFLAGLLLLFNRFFLLSSHGFRYATQDPMLHVLQFFALWIFYSWFQDFKTNRQVGLSKAMLFGTLVGISCLTKNVLGFVAPAICFVFLLSAGELVNFCKANWKPIFIALALALVLPLSYMLPHFIFTPGAFENLFISEVVQRSTIGEHHVDNPWYYILRMSRGEFLPLGFILVALSYGFYQAVCSKSKELRRLYLFLLIWAIFPVFSFSLVSSRLFWYIAESFPAICILGALACIELSKNIVTNSPKIAKLVSLVLLVISVYQLPRHFYRTWTVSTVRQARIDLAKALPEMMKGNAKILAYAPVFSYHEKFASRVEKIYLGILNPNITFEHNSEDFLSKANDSQFDFVLTPRSMLEQTKTAVEPKMFMVLNTDTHRKERVFVLSRKAGLGEGFRVSE